jgi:hypothetical protein
MESSNEEREDAHICWEGRGIDLTASVEDLDEASPSVKFFDYTWSVRWKDVHRNCDLCVELKALFQQPWVMQRISQADSPSFLVHVLGDIRLKHVRLQVFDPSPLHSISLIPSVLTRHVDANLQDLHIMKWWIKDCQVGHAESRVDQHTSRNFPLKVINCVSGKLCYIEPDTPYICLSYVWGPTSPTVNPLPDVAQTLPKTIADAMWVALELEIPYLWVDRYCIDQTNDSEKQYLIQRMNVIYSDAALTIVAAAGDGPHHGLPGINHTYRPSPAIITRPSSLEYMAIHEPMLELSGSTWGTRAWTFQEYYLSRRRLIFTDTQVYLTCKTRHYIESFTVENEDSPTTDNSNPGILAIFENTFYFDPESTKVGEISGLYERLQEYYQRTLSYPEDIIQAFLGIVHDFGMAPGTDPLLATQVHGLPVFYRREPMVASPSATFARSLSWSISVENKTWDIPTTRSMLFPSWSWACIKANRHKASVGHLHFELNSDIVSQQEDIRIWITCNSGDRIDLNDYITRIEHHNNADIGKCIHIKTWTTPCQVEVANGEHSVSGFAEGYVRLDYPKLRPKDDVVTIYLGIKQFSTRASFVALIAEKSGPETYRRIGLYNSYSNLHADGQDLQSFLNASCPSTDWELRTISLV